MRILICCVFVLLTGCTYGHCASGGVRGPYLLHRAGRVEEIYDVNIRWEKPLFIVGGGAYLFDRRDPSNLAVANVYRFGEEWRSPERLKLISWLLADQPSERLYYVLSLHPVICIGRSTAPNPCNSRFPAADMVDERGSAAKITHLISCPWMKYPSTELDVRKVPPPTTRLIAELPDPVAIADWMRQPTGLPPLAK